MGTLLSLQIFYKLKTTLIFESLLKNNLNLFSPRVLLIHSFLLDFQNLNNVEDITLSPIF